MSDGPLDYHLNLAAATELEKQTQRAKRILERMAAHLAANQPDVDGNLEDLVEQQHVRQAAELLFGSVEGSASELAPDPNYVFISFSHNDDAFVAELTNGLTKAGVAWFKADRDIRPASEWGEAIWRAICDCRIFLSVLTPRFINSRWCDLEGGAACASKREVMPVLRYVNPHDVPVPFSRFQAAVVENSEQLQRLIAVLKERCKKRQDDTHN